ncbi:hypothetical protein ACFIQF_22080 [Comamonas sp. J-3]|uniref:hypothetical protein n=1 Tax=Comamonas trifloxystrobinivorans TaxID=3350256 RepID=UPI0037269EAB
MPVRVYGFIEGYTDYIQDDHNLEQIRQLPSTGVYLPNYLFSLVPYCRHAYYGSHIHFAAGYKEFYTLEREWIEEFELLLSKLYWSSAEAMLTWSQERYIWDSDYSSSMPTNVTNQIVKRRKLESAWELKEVPWNS